MQYNKQSNRKYYNWSFCTGFTTLPLLVLTGTGGEILGVGVGTRVDVTVGIIVGVQGDWRGHTFLCGVAIR